MTGPESTLRAPFGDPEIPAGDRELVTVTDADPDRPGLQTALDWWAVPIDGRDQPVPAPSAAAARTWAVATWTENRGFAPSKVGRPRPLTATELTSWVTRVQLLTDAHHRLGGAPVPQLHRDLAAIAGTGPASRGATQSHATERSPITVTDAKPPLVDLGRIWFVIRNLADLAIWVAIGVAPMLAKTTWAFLQWRAGTLGQNLNIGISAAIWVASYAWLLVWVVGTHDALNWRLRSRDEPPPPLIRRR